MSHRNTTSCCCFLPSFNNIVLSNHVRRINKIKAIAFSQIWHETVFETMWNCREKKWNNVSKECILTLFEKIGNCRNLLTTMSLKHALWRYLKRFGTADKNENNVSKSMHWDGIWNNLELQRKRWKECN